MDSPGIITEQNGSDTATSRLKSSIETWTPASSNKDKAASSDVSINRLVCYKKDSWLTGNAKRVLGTI